MRNIVWFKTERKLCTLHVHRDYADVVQKIAEEMGRTEQDVVEAAIRLMADTLISQEQENE